MPIDAKFTADFSQFTTATKSAQSELDKLITKSDGTAKAIGTSFKSASNATQDWTKDLSKFDGILSAAGVNISSQVRAITELKAATSGAAGSMSTLAIAGTAVGVAIAAWNLTEWIEKTFDLNNKIANLNGSLDALKAIGADEKMALLARASALAKQPITDVAEALKWVNAAEKDRRLLMEYSRTAMADTAKATAAWAAEIATVRQRGDLGHMNADIKAGALSLDEMSKKYGVHTQALSVYIRQYQANQGELKKAMDELRQREEKATEEAKKFTAAAAEAWGGAWQSMLTQGNNLLRQQNEQLRASVDLTNQKIIAELNAGAQTNARSGLDVYGNRPPDAGSMEAATLAYEKQRAALVALGGSTKQLNELYLQFQDTIVGTIPPVQTLGDKAQEGGNKTHHAGQQAAGAVAGYQALGNAANYVAASFQNMYTQVGHAAGYESSLRTMNDMLSEYGRAGVPVHGGLIPGAPHRAAGGSVASGSPYWVGERGPELFVPKTSGSIVPAGATGGVTVNVYGSVLSTQRELATLVEEAMMRTYRQGGNRQPV